MKSKNLPFNVTGDIIGQILRLRSNKNWNFAQDDEFKKMILPIIEYPNPLLKKKAEKIRDVNDPQIKELIFDMLETLDNAQGLGLAAPQIGKSVRLCIVKFDRTPKSKTYILINPKIKSKSLGKEILEEGCLSFPGQYLPIKRYKKVTVLAQDRKGEEIIIKADGILARAFQHEIDHLDGVLFIDRAGKKRKMVAFEDKK